MDNINVKGCKYYVENNGVEAQGCYELTDLCECNKENEFCDNNPNCYYKQLKAKEQECEELKETIDGLLKVQYALAESCNKYSETLAEIRDIATNHQFPVCEYDGFWILYGVKKRILQKISEVEDES